MSQELPPPFVEPLAILLVEDDPDLRASLSEVLHEEGYRVEAVPSGAEAVALSAKQQFDLIVTDIKTPGGTDGLAALEKVKEDNPEVAGIVITGYSTEEYATRAARLRVENYLKKPFDIEDFLKTVDVLAEKKRRAQRVLGKEITMQRALRWLSSRLLERASGRPVEEVEAFFRQLGGAAPGAFRDARETLSLETLGMLRALAEQGVAWPKELDDVFPPRVLQALATAPLRDHLDGGALAFASGGEVVESRPDEDPESLPGSLLNVALLLESTERFSEARMAFEDLLSSRSDPSQRYLAHFGLARLARERRHFEEMERQTRLAAEEARMLGPITYSQALAERGLLLAECGCSGAREALQEAWEQARGVKDTGSFALLSLAREHYFGLAGASRARLLSYLMEPEHFSLAVEAGGWMLEMLLTSGELEAEERRFLARLLRATPAAFERLLLHTDKVPVMHNALGFLETLGEERRQRVLLRLASVEDPELRRAVGQWSGGRRGQERPLLRIFSLSGLRLYLDDEALEMKRKKPLLLLLYLVYRNSPVAEESVLELFWPGEEARARASLRTTLSYLRKLVCPGGDVDPLIRQANGLRFSEEVPVWFDHREFEALIERAKSLESSNPSRALEAFRSAVRLYRGPFLENVYDDWALEVRQAAELSYEHALRYLATANLAAKSWAQAYEYAARGLRRDPLSQPFCELTMQALLGLQRPHDALQAFEQCRALLRQELDLEPSTDMLRYREMARMHL